MTGARTGSRSPATLVALAALAALVVGVVGVEPVGAAPPPGRTYRPPVDAPVVDPFRPPPSPWLAGNRGLEYATTPGTPVRAIGPGVVTFAGPVAGALFVTVTHPDGLRSSYSFLAAVRTAVGRRVAGGTVVGVAAARFHVGVRRGDTYLDPASLWGTGVGGGRVVLVPLDGGAAPGPAPPTRPVGREGAGAPGRSAARALVSLGEAATGRWAAPR